MFDFAVTDGHYIPLALALFLGGTPALVTAMYLVVTGTLSSKILLIISVATTLVWDAIWYLIGYFVPISKLEDSKFFKKRRPLYRKYLYQYEGHKHKLVFMSRFVYGMNSLFSIICGIFSMNFWKFIGLSGVSMVIWFYLIRWLSVFIHSHVNKLGLTENVFFYIPIFLLFMLAILWLVKRFLFRSMIQKG